MKTQFEIQYGIFDNNNDALIPEIWANESLMVLFDNIITPMLVHRDFEDEVANFGDVINTRRPDKFTMLRKSDRDDVTDQDAVSTNVQVPLDQHGHVSFIIRDGEESKSMKQLVSYYLEPAMMGIAEGIEQTVLGQRFDFLEKSVGGLGDGIDKQTLIDIGVSLDEQAAPNAGRNLILSPSSHGDVLNIDTFHEVDKSGDAGQALRDGLIGRAFNLDIYKNNSARSIQAGQTATTTASSAASKGATVINFTSAANIEAGEWFVITGDNVPYKCLSKATNAVTIAAPGLRSSIASGSNITITRGGLVNNAGGYSTGHYKALAYDGTGTSSVQTTQLVSIGDENYGTIADPSPSTHLTLNHLLRDNVADNTRFGLGPAGDYNWAFHRNAVALVTRPLALPRPQMGVESAIVNDQGIGVRVVISYDAKAQGHRVTIDLLYGVATLDNRLGRVVFG